MIVIIPALAYTGQAPSIISIFRLFPLNIRFPVLKDMIALAFIVLKVLCSWSTIYLSFSTIANVCLSVCPFICHKAKPFNSLKSSSFIIHLSSFIILHSSFILHHSSFILPQQHISAYSVP